MPLTWPCPLKFEVGVSDVLHAQISVRAGPNFWRAMSLCFGCASAGFAQFSASEVGPRFMDSVQPPAFKSPP